MSEVDFFVDDELMMHSPHTGDDRLVIYRGKTSDGKAVVYRPDTGWQGSVPFEWLRPLS